MKSHAEKGDNPIITSVKEDSSVLGPIALETKDEPSKTSYLSSSFFGSGKAPNDGGADGEKENRAPCFVRGLRKRLKTSSSMYGGPLSSDRPLNGFVPFPSTNSHKRNYSVCNDSEADNTPTSAIQDSCNFEICPHDNSGGPIVDTNNYDSPQTPFSGQSVSDSFFKRFSYTPATGSEAKQNEDFGKAPKSFDISRPMSSSVSTKLGGCLEQQPKRPGDWNGNHNTPKGTFPNPVDKIKKGVESCIEKSAKKDRKNSVGVNIFVEFQFRGFEY